MKHQHKIISFFLSFTILLGAFNISSFAFSATQTDLVETNVVSGTTGDCTWTLNGTILTVSGNGEMADYNYWSDTNKAPWGTSVTAVTISNGVTRIGTDAFYNCTDLTNVVVPDSVTSIGRSAFSETEWYENQPDGVVYVGKVAYKMKGYPCPKTVRIKDGTISIAIDAFAYCSELKNVIIPYTVTKIEEHAFAACQNLTNITIPDSVTNIGQGAFLYTAWYENQPEGLIYVNRVAYEMKGKCPAEVIIKDGTVSITDSAFYNCKELSKIVIPASVGSLGNRVIEGCSGLENITVVKGNAFYDSRNNCNALIESETNTLLFGCKNTVIPDSVTSISERAFYECSGLTSINIPDSVTNIGEWAFYNCLNLTKVVLPKSNLVIGDYAFFCCPSLLQITIPKNIVAIGIYSLGFNEIYQVTPRYAISNFVIYGYKSTVAERYANDNGFTFIALDDNPKPKVGDADGDGEITLMDVTNVQHYLSSMHTGVEDDVLMSADVDKNGLLEIIDTTWIQRHLAGMEIPYAIG